MSEDSFDIGAGNICLDFANTNDWHASKHPIENLHNYSDLVRWAKAAGLLAAESAGRLIKLADEQSGYATQAYNFAIHTRETIYRIFSNRYAGKPIAETDMDALNAVVCEAMTHRRLVPKSDEFQWEWTDDSDGDGANLILWMVALTAAELLTSDKISLVRVCEDDRGCGFLFIDMSKNHSRRWCSMESCGNRAKARRHYSRSRKEQ
jgi:predicted RNA-binding Zn ribbon-like protein